MNSTKKFITIEQAANELLKSSRRFVYQQIESGNLGLYKVGRKSYVDRQEVENLFKPVKKEK